MRRDYQIGVVLYGICAAVYMWTLCPSVYVEGSGELIGATWWLGTPHPTGYPLYALLGRVLAQLMPFASPAMSVNAATALLAAGAGPAMFLLLRQQGISPTAAIAAAAALVWGRTFWGQAVIAEVYGLFVLASLLVLIACLRARRACDDRQRWLLISGYIGGMAATCHLQAVLLLPSAAAVALWRGRSQWARIPRDLVQIGLGGMGGASLLLYLVVRNQLGPGFHWGPLSSAAGLWDHVTGALYRTSFILLPWPALAAALGRLAAQLTAEWPVLLLPAMAWGVAAGWARHRALTAAVAGAAGLNLIAGLTYHRDPAGLGVFFLLSITAACVCLGLGLDDIERRLRRRLPRAATLSSLMCAIAVIGANLAQADRSGASLPDTYGRQLLAELPAGTVLFTDGDDASYIVDYLHRIEGVRPDVQIYHRMGRGTDLAAGPEQLRPVLRRRAEVGLIRSGRPVHFLVPRMMPADEYTFQPFGLSYRAVPRLDDTAPALSANPVALLSAGGAGNDAWVGKLAANCWYMAAEYHRATGADSAAVEAYKRAAALAPQSLSTNYNVSLNLLQLNRIEEAEQFAMQALAADPLRRGPYRLAAEILSRLGRIEAARAVHKKAGVWAVVP